MTCNAAPGIQHCLTRGHNRNWYIIPVEHMQEWDEWLEFDSDDQRSWEPPEFAQLAGKHPEKVVFTDWEIW